MDIGYFMCIISYTLPWVSNYFPPRFDLSMKNFLEREFHTLGDVLKKAPTGGRINFTLTVICIFIQKCISTNKLKLGMKQVQT